MVDDDDESVDSIVSNEALPDFKEIARDIQNRASGRVLSKETEAQLFHEFFGTSVRIVNILWEFLVRDRFRPQGGRLWHLLWALYFMKVCPKQGSGCAVVGASQVQSTQRPTGNGYGPSLRPFTSLLTWW